MPSISYRDLLGGEATTSIEFNGHAIELTYDPASITDSAFRDIKQMAQQAQAVAAPEGDGSSPERASEMSQALAAIDSVLSLSDTVNALLCRFLRRWSLDDEPGQMFPLTPERLGDLPLAFRQAVLNALMSAGQMGEANGTTPKPR